MSEKLEAIGCSICDPKGFTVLIAPHDFHSKGKTAQQIAGETAFKLNQFENMRQALEKTSELDRRDYRTVRNGSIELPDAMLGDAIEVARKVLAEVNAKML